jgi:hypothetical protein
LCLFLSLLFFHFIFLTSPWFLFVSFPPIISFFFSLLFLRLLFRCHRFHISSFPHFVPFSFATIACFSFSPSFFISSIFVPAVPSLLFYL